jgi:hypothetical protein
MASSHRERVRELLRDAAARHDTLLAQLPPEIGNSLPVDAQGVTRAIDHLAAAAGMSVVERRALVSPHAVNPAVLHARVFGRAPLGRGTVIASFVEGARVRADALGSLADTVGGEELGQRVRQLLVSSPPPVDPGQPGVVAALRSTYEAQEQAAMMIAAGLDDVEKI